MFNTSPLSGNRRTITPSTWQRCNEQGDPRSYSKRLESDHMIKVWKEKAPKQAQWFTKHPTQVLKQAKQVWKWSVESGKGKAWLYFIFAICQWLPTNYRMNYQLDDPRKRCNLCLCNSMDTMDHLLQCPALAKNIFISNKKLVASSTSGAFLTPPLPSKRAIANILLPNSSQTQGWNY